MPSDNAQHLPRPKQGPRELIVLLIGEIPEGDKLDDLGLVDHNVHVRCIRVGDIDDLEVALDRRAIDAVVIDAIPDGLNVLRTVRERRPVTPVLMIADAEQIDVIIAAKKAGLERYVLRPADADKGTQLFCYEVRSMLSHIVEPPSVESPSAEALHRYAQYYNVKEPFFVISPSRRLIYVNQAGRQVLREHFGVHLEVGDRVEMFSVEHDTEAFREHVDRAFDGEAAAYQQRIDRQTPVFQRIAYQPVVGANGRVLAVSIAATNVTELRTIELQKAASQERLWQMFDALPLPLALLDDHASPVRVNPAFGQLLGDEQGADALTPLCDQFDQWKAGERAYVHKQIELRDQNGRVVWVDLTGLPITAPEGDADARWVVLMVDISSHKETERKLERSSRLHALGELAGGVAHDFNNVLGIVVTYADMLEMRLQEHGDQRIQEWIEKLHDAVERGRTLTHQLLTFSRNQHAERELVQLNETVRNLVDLLGRIIGADIELRVDLDPALPLMSANPAQLEQVLMNLVVNARDAMPEGGVLTISTGCESAPAPVGSQVVLAVEDTGTGMDQQTQERLFEPFFTTKPKGKGTGLGMATVYGIVEDAEGSIHVDSEIGEGTTIELRFPVQQECAAPSSLGDRTSGEGKSPALLVVEDQDELRRAFCDYLDGLGYQVREASSLAEAREQFDAANAEVDLLLTDIVLPDGSGLDLSENLREGNPSLGVVFMSGYVSALREETIGQSRRIFLPKPVGLSEVHDAVRELCESR